MSVTDQESVLLMDEAHVERTIERMTLELFEQHPVGQTLQIVGIDDKGYWLAQQIVDCWTRVADDPIDIGQWHVKSDGNNRGDELRKSKPTQLVLVDDVIFSGSTMMKAIEEIIGYVRPTSLMTLTLIDRGHRKWPIMANILGKKIPTKLNEHVEVIFDQDGAVKKVELQWLSEK